MGKPRFTKEQVILAVREHEAGIAAEVICRRHGISAGTFDRWQARYAVTGSPKNARSAPLAQENRRLRLRLADALLRVTALEDQLARASGEAETEQSDGNRS